MECYPLSARPMANFGAYMPTCLVSAFREEKLAFRGALASLCVAQRSKTAPNSPISNRTELVARHFCSKNHARSSFRAKTARNFHSRGAFSYTEVFSRQPKAAPSYTETVTCHSRSKSCARSPFRAIPLRPVMRRGLSRQPKAAPSYTEVFSRQLNASPVIHRVFSC